MFDSDDPGFGRPEVEVDTEIPVKDPAHDVTKAQYHPASIWGFEQEKWCTDLQATFQEYDHLRRFLQRYYQCQKADDDA